MEQSDIDSEKLLFTIICNMFYFLKHNSWIKIGEKPKMTPEEAKQFLAEKRETQKCILKRLSLPLYRKK